ncbi:uncharacterized protein [Hyperolius riggenbachi]|uniref:uncharacterized protein isoform X2 n=1 Tax=Hyperolius riggenbachi TaxID=752182 RepID=UPI0035A2C3AA
MGTSNFSQREDLVRCSLRSPPLPHHSRFETCIENGLISLKHKIRNIEKKKVKLEDYRDRLNNGEELNSDQLSFVEYMKPDLQEPIRLSVLRTVQMSRPPEVQNPIDVKCIKPEAIKPWSTVAMVKVQEPKRWQSSPPLIPLTKPFETVKSTPQPLLLLQKKCEADVPKEVFKVNAPLPPRKEMGIGEDPSYSPEYQQTFTTASTQTLPHGMLEVNGSDLHSLGSEPPAVGSTYTTYSAFD